MAGAQTGAAAEAQEAGPRAQAAVAQRARPRPLVLAGLFLVTLATLALEILDIRLLSVATWYHLSFFAVSIAMLGMAAGALAVYRGGARYEGAAALEALPRRALQLAVSIPLSHVALLVVPLGSGLGLHALASLAVATFALAIPFYLSGIVVALALTRVPGPIGLVYAADLGGAALGTLLVLPLLEATDASTAVLACGVLAALGALCFALEPAVRWVRWPTIGLFALLALTLANAGREDRLRMWFVKGRQIDWSRVVEERWSPHAQVLVLGPVAPGYPFWAGGHGAPSAGGERLSVVIDGGAATGLTRWDGRREALDWVRHDVTALGFHLRQGGQAGVVGVGGGRDVLTALWAGSKPVTGIEINRDMLALLQESQREFTRIADHPDVRLVHDEARSFLARTDERYDLLQMSLIDTWAATGAGAMTLTENGLYTLDGWRVFLGVLRPGGIFAVSRWYDPGRVSETSRLMALATAALLERGVQDPEQHLALVSCKNVAALLVSNEPLGAEDLRRIDAAVAEEGFEPLAVPGRPPANELLARILRARNAAELERAVVDPDYDYSPPTDERPFFFNMLKPARALSWGLVDTSPGVLGGNLVATQSLLALFFVALVAAAAAILAPLALSGLPAMGAGAFATSSAYFTVIGLGFMLVQVPCMQRFSVYLGHPTHAVIAVLFTMILATGIGSLVSDRVPAEARPRILRFGPLAIAGALIALSLAIQPLIENTIHLGLAGRAALVILVVAPPAFLLGFCFPIGVRLVQRIAPAALPWMWGINGAASVLAGVSAIAISMWYGIDANLHLAAALYATLALSAPALFRLGRTAWGQGITTPSR
jgi:SAM-dependent methyltransferase